MLRATYTSFRRHSEAAQRCTYTLQKHGDLRRNVNELLGPEVVLRVPEQLNEGHYGAPWVRTMHHEALEQHARHDLLELLVLDLGEEVKEERAEPIGVGVRVA